jgi:hypothetical protein
MRAIIFLAGAVMAASWGLTWIEPPFAGVHLSPMSLVRDGRLVLGPDSPWQSWVFLGGFAAAALAALLALGGRRPWLLALGAGLSPFVLLGDALIRAETLRQDLGLPFPFDFADLRASWALLENFVRLGLWAYLGGAAILVVAGLSLMGRSR